jgi:hypothetical protein
LHGWPNQSFPHPRSQCLASAHPLLRRDPGMVWSRESWPRAILSRGSKDSIIEHLLID